MALGVPILKHFRVVKLVVMLCHVYLLEGCNGLGVFVRARLLTIANSRILRPLSFVLALQLGPHTSSQSARIYIPILAFQFPCTTMQNIRSMCLVYNFLELLIESLGPTHFLCNKSRE